ncbi:MAG: hypothetical protein JWN70_2497 [Planctomycetaceae bacterium]|nr:hypothetical protein [Planctomycetaceae bacterium]
MGVRTKWGWAIGVLLCSHSVFADEAELLKQIFRNHSEAVAKADFNRARALDKARDETVAQLTRIAARAYKSSDRLAENNAWKAVLKLDRSNKKAVQYFTDLGTLDKVLAEVANPSQAAVSKSVMASASFQTWMRDTAALPADKQVEAVSKKLVALNPGFDGKITPTIESGAVTGLSLATDNVVDIAPVRVLSGLKSLTCAGSSTASPLADLSPLQGLKLTYLDCKNTAISDLTPLQGMGLTQLVGDFTAISDLAPLKGMPLSSLGLSVTPVTDLTPLAGMKLVSLACSSTQVSDFSPLRGMPLKYLHFSGTKVSDLAPLKGMSLDSISMMGVPVADLSPLAGMKLTGLSMSGTQVTDLAPLKGMPLGVLFIQDTKATQLSPLQGMPLKILWCDVKQPADVTILRSIKTLEKINDVPVAEFLQKQSAK